MDRDVEERRAFEDRLRAKDEAKTEKAGAVKLSRAEREEEARRKYGE